MKLLKIYFFLIICIVLIHKPLLANEPSKNKEIKKEIEIKFDIPQLLKMNIEQVKKKLGIPKSEIIPTKLQLEIDPSFLSSTEYQKGTTIIFY